MDRQVGHGQQRRWVMVSTGGGLWSARVVGSSGGLWSAAAVGRGLQLQLFILSTSAII